MLRCLKAHSGCCMKKKMITPFFLIQLCLSVYLMSYIVLGVRNARMNESLRGFQ